MGLLLVKSRRLPEDGLDEARADENEAGACLGSTMVGTCCYNRTIRDNVRNGTNDESHIIPTWLGTPHAMDLVEDIKYRRPSRRLIYQHRCYDDIEISFKCLFCVSRGMAVA